MILEKISFTFNGETYSKLYDREHKEHYYPITETEEGTLGGISSREIDVYTDSEIIESFNKDPITTNQTYPSGYFIDTLNLNFNEVVIDAISSEKFLQKYGKQGLCFDYLCVRELRSEGSAMIFIYAYKDPIYKRLKDSREMFE
jgi:hypothetical protein